MIAKTIEWCPILGAPGYDVSSDGRVRSWRACGNTGMVRQQPLPALLKLRETKKAALDAAAAAVDAMPSVRALEGTRQEIEEDALLLVEAPPSLLRDIAGRWANKADEVATTTIVREAA